MTGDLAFDLGNPVIDKIDLEAARIDPVGPGIEFEADGAVARRIAIVHQHRLLAHSLDDLAIADRVFFHLGEPLVDIGLQGILISE